MQNLHNGFFSFRNRYIPALLIIALFSILGFVNVKEINSSIENEGKIINISGRQRMLSQRLVLLASNYLHEPNISTRNELLKNIVNMEKAHFYLLKYNSSATVEDIYEKGLDIKVRNFIEQFKLIATDDGDIKILENLKKESQYLLDDLDFVVHTYEIEYEERLRALQLKGKYLLLGIFLVLFLEWIFIFRPASLKIKENIDELEEKIQDKIEALEELNKNLEEKIAIEVEKNREKDLQIFQNAKMASLGEMISNIAHQWRQPLSGISTMASGMLIAKEFGTLTDKIFVHYCEKIVENTLYLSETINTFRDFIRDDKELTNIILQERIQTILHIQSATLNHHHISLIDNVDYSQPISMNLFAGEFDQVLMNIITNAKDILLTNQIKEPWIQIGLEDKKDKVILTIEDNAGGISDEILPHIFEPYFTTKHQSQGTGLGLYMSYKIVVESLGGNLYAKNSEFGAKFFIELPKES
jgi:signal transduction histidine kinase